MQCNVIITENGTSSLSQNYNTITTYVEQSSPSVAYNETLLHECKTKRKFSLQKNALLFANRRNLNFTTTAALPFNKFQKTYSMTTVQACLSLLTYSNWGTDGGLNCKHQITHVDVESNVQPLTMEYCE
ncbi:hypothetical protein Tsp_10465 [Trichinella spiralis]|uniref:hypothetical protein n=1 Tax=Trichinella spiralis TaxID=6334 RepID=UPI0001EFEE7A|nr:hypothetical protein Tsp_10465 [Trichinella spiralis]